MSSSTKSRKTVEFGDFQTPITLARQVCRLLAQDRGLAPSSVVEPTCGVGNFLVAAFDQFPSAIEGIGVEINPTYVDKLTESLRPLSYGERIQILGQSFFETDWATVFRELPEPILAIGNPPWVTNADLGALGSVNLPAKANFQNHNGLDAMTGKSNFDISEWMLIRLTEILDGRNATLAVLCKTAVARKVLLHAWKSEVRVFDAEIRVIDAAKYFDAAVEACLLICSFGSSTRNLECRVYSDLVAATPADMIGYHDGHLIANIAAYQRWKHLQGREIHKWRSGVKHDSSKVMEFRREGIRYRNGHGELVDLEDDYMYPMLKSSELAKDRVKEPRRWMLVPQRLVGDETGPIREHAPKTWKYLLEHGEALDRRRSSIYRNRPRFSVFGIGDYTFSPWKVAISGFYKRLHFSVVGEYSKKPIVLDDTAYFLACRSEAEAELVASALNSAIAREFFSAYIFWDAKRPITADVLRRLDLYALSRELGVEDSMSRLVARSTAELKQSQPCLFDTA